MSAPQSSPNDRLRRAVFEARMTPEQLARKIEVDPKTVQRWITQGRIPYPVHQFAVAVAIGVPEKELWPNAFEQSRHLRAVPQDMSESRPSTIRIVGGRAPAQRDHTDEHSEARHQDSAAAVDRQHPQSESEPRTKRSPADKQGSVLKSLTKQREWTYSQFVVEYDRVAAQVHGDRAGTAPTTRTVRRWMTGEGSTPHAYHRKVLERMFPDYSAAELVRQPGWGSGGQPHTEQADYDQDAPDPQSRAAFAARMRELMTWVGTEAPIKEHEIRDGAAKPSVQQSMEFWGNHSERNVRTREEIQTHYKNSYSRGGGVERSR
ncbi:hypothetical protein ABZ942_14940 [Nocardia sp. NPDC046473]|uniref:hypothetical protein n=1 Tax=Nocardia sp. NPDC046473 TaxID=3155733 RepID=UPI0033C4C24E